MMLKHALKRRIVGNLPALMRFFGQEGTEQEY
jgi:hypothetical protein